MNEGANGNRLAVGLLLGLVAAASFGMSGPFAKALMASGWTPAAAVTWRVAIGGLVLLPAALLSLRGRLGTLRRGSKRILLFGLVAVMVCQLAFFQALETLSVGVALLIEYLGVVMVVFWLWVRRGERPTLLTIIGSLLAVVGLVLVLDLSGPQSVDAVGVLWALAAAVGIAAYFLISADESDGLPGFALASGGLLVGAGLLLLAGWVGAAPLTWNSQPVTLGGQLLPWWVVALALGLIAAALSYGAGIQASRRLGSKLAGFVGLTEVLFAVAAAALLLGELPSTVQLFGGALITAGVVVVRLDESRGERPASLAEARAPAPEFERPRGGAVPADAQLRDRA